MACLASKKGKAKGKRLLGADEEAVVGGVLPHTISNRRPRGPQYVSPLPPYKHRHTGGKAWDDNDDQGRNALALLARPFLGFLAVPGCRDPAADAAVTIIILFFSEKHCCPSTHPQQGPHIKTATASASTSFSFSSWRLTAGGLAPLSVLGPKTTTTCCPLLKPLPSPASHRGDAPCERGLGSGGAECGAGDGAF